MSSENQEALGVATQSDSANSTGSPPGYQADSGDTPAPPAPSDSKAKEDETEEPQNALTQRFTEDEWAGVKALRQQLPEVFADAFIDSPKLKEVPHNLWGVKVDPRGAKDARVSVVLCKFIRARNNNVMEAREMLRETLRWRVQFDIEAAMQEHFPEEVFGKLGHIYGKDREGRPVIYNLYGANKDHRAVFGDVERFLRWRVALMEKSMALLDFENIDQTVQVHDYAGVGLTSSRDANSKRAASEATSIFAGHYPELLHRKFFINVPMLMDWMFWLFKPLISANTVAKMSVVGTSEREIAKALLPIIDAGELPKR
jgi:hypothetical protein